MKNNRIISYQLSQKISQDELRDISAASMTGQLTNVVTNNGPGGSDVDSDWAMDF